MNKKNREKNEGVKVKETPVLLDLMIIISSIWIIYKTMKRMKEIFIATFPNVFILFNEDIQIPAEMNYTDLMYPILLVFMLYLLWKMKEH